MLESAPYRAAGAGPPAISRLSPILRWRPGPELRQEGKSGAAAQWLQPAQQNNATDRVQVGRSILHDGKAHRIRQA